jgi:hypothetical protein
VNRHPGTCAECRIVRQCCRRRPIFVFRRARDFRVRASRGTHHAPADQPHRAHRSAVDAAQQAAHKTIEETTIIRLAVEDQRLIMEALLNPPEPTEGLRRAFEAHRKLFGEM